MPPLLTPVTADWVTAHPSLVYPAAGVKITKVRHVSATAMAHTKVDEPLTSAKGLSMVVIGFADGHGEAVAVDRIRAVLAESKKELDAARPKP